MSTAKGDTHRREFQVGRASGNGPHESPMCQKKLRLFRAVGPRQPRLVAFGSATQPSKKKVTAFGVQSLRVLGNRSHSYKPPFKPPFQPPRKPPFQPPYKPPCSGSL